MKRKMELQIFSNKNKTKIVWNKRKKSGKPIIRRFYSLLKKCLKKKCKWNDLQVDVLLVATEILESLYTHPSMIYIQYSKIYLEERLHLHLEVQIKMLLLPSLKMDQYQLPIIHQMSSERKKWRAIFWFINTCKLD